MLISPPADVNTLYVHALATVNCPVARPRTCTYTPAFAGLHVLHAEELRSPLGKGLITR